MLYPAFTYAAPIVTPEGLEPRFTLPDNFHYTSLEGKSGHLRVGYAAPMFQPRGVVVILPGLSEFIEKYFETTRDLLAQNYAVVVLDWGGQGCSPRAFPHAPQRRHVKSLEPDADDVTQLLRSNLVASFGAPVHVLAHSMGGLVYLTAATRANPLPVSSAVITAPLLGLPQFAGLSGVVLRPTLALLKLLAPTAYIPGGHDWHGREREPAGTGIYSTDPARDSLQNKWLAANPCLQTGSPTNAWVAAALAAAQRLEDPDVMRQLTVPTLVLLADNEKVVDNRASQILLRDNPMVKMETIAGAKHEILMERDSMRQAALNALFTWIDRAATLQVMNAYVPDEGAGRKCGCSTCACGPR